MSTAGAGAGPDPRRWVEASFLRNVQYADASNLVARQSIYAYQRPYIGLYDWALDFAELNGDETILDVGCGNGGYLRALHRRGHHGLTIGMDFSAGMLASARDAVGAKVSQPLVQGDAAVLPFASGSVGVALAMHMLYHIADRVQVLLELRRVVGDDGVILIVLNSPGHIPELRTLVREGLAKAALPLRAPAGDPLDLDAGEQLASRYFSVERHEVAGELVVTEPRPVVDYVRSMSLARPGRTDEEVLLRVVEERVSASIAAEGAFHISTASGCLVCR